MSRMIKKRKQKSVDWAPVWGKFRLFTFAVASRQPPLLGLPQTETSGSLGWTWGFQAFCPKSLLSCSAHSPDIIPQNCSSKMSLHCDVEKTLPILVPSSYPLDPEKEVALCLKLISIIRTSPKFMETLPLDYLALIAARLCSLLETKENQAENSKGQWRSSRKVSISLRWWKRDMPGFLKIFCKLLSFPNLISFLPASPPSTSYTLVFPSGNQLHLLKPFVFYQLFPVTLFPLHHIVNKAQ